MPQLPPAPTTIRGSIAHEKEASDQLIGHDPPSTQKPLSPKIASRDKKLAWEDTS